MIRTVEDEKPVQQKATAWIKVEKKHCSGNSFSKTYPDLQTAQTACEQLGSKWCAGVYDSGCDNKGSFKLCMSGKALENSKFSSCVYTPKFGAPEQTTGAQS